jgi:hypothetical protein
MTAPTKGDRVMFDGRPSQPPESRDDAPNDARGRAMAVKPYHLVPAGSTHTLCGDDVTGWRAVDVPWGGVYDCKRCRAALADSNA